MSLLNLVHYFIIWGFIGILLFTIFVIILFRSGLVYENRRRDGLMKKKISLKGQGLGLILLLGLVFIQLLAAFFSIKPFHPQISFGYLFILSFSLYLIYLIFDTLVIDFLVICLWRPRFMKIPDTMNFGSMKKHIFLSLPIGTLIGAVLTSVSTWLIRWLILN